jgi:ComF family protein
VKEHALIKKAVDIFFPAICYACRENPPENSRTLCASCREKLPFIEGNLCPACGGVNDGIFLICPKCLKEEPRPWKNACAVMNYDGKAMELIKNLKYNKASFLARLLGEMAAEKWMKNKIHADCVVPIPLHWTRMLKRGYNQSELVASVFSKITGIPMLKLLKRSKMTPKQAFLSREQRKKNLSAAFNIAKKKIYYFKIRRYIAS